MSAVTIAGKYLLSKTYERNRPINNQTAFNEGGLGPHWWNVPLKDFIDPAFTYVRPTI